MAENRVQVNKGTFRSFLVPVAAVLCCLAALSGLCSVGLLFFPGSMDALTQDLVLGGITDRTALQSWKFIHSAVTVACFGCSAVSAACLVLVLAGKISQGLVTLSTAGEWLLRGIYLSGVVALAILAFRLIRYIVLCCGVNEGAYLLYAMLISEALMVAQAWLLFVLIKRFLNCLSDTSASIAFTLTAGELRGKTISGFTATGFFLLGIVNGLIAADRLFTVTIVDSFPQDYYAVLTAGHPLLLFSGAAFGFASLADFLLALYLRRYKRITERLSFRSLKE